MTTSAFEGPQIVCTACGAVTNSLKPLCDDCEKSLAEFRLTPPDITPFGEDARFVEQGVRVYEVNDMEWWAGIDKRSVIEACLAAWGGTMEEYFEDGEDSIEAIDLDENEINLNEDCLPDGPFATYREHLRTMIAENAPIPGFFAGMDY